MSMTEKLRQQLMHYFACVGRTGRVYGPRDFNSQVMMNAFDPHDRAALDDALWEMVEAGVLQRSSPLEFTLTSAGLDQIRRLRRHRPSSVPS
jgi:hypothetical protein